MPAWLAVFGRMHPLLVHLPIGLLLGLAALELYALASRRPAPRAFVCALAWLAAGAAVATAASGWVLSREDGYGGATLDTHRTLGIILAACAVLLACFATANRASERPTALAGYRVLLFVAAGLLVPAGHLGATMTHGEGFLLAPLRAKPDAPPVALALASSGSRASFASTIAPIFQEHCAACHLGSKKKGGLSLADRESILAGGRSKRTVVPGRPEASELVRRLGLPLDDDDHMPPAEKPQPSSDEIRAIEAWIAADAPFDGGFEVAPASAAPAPPALSQTPSHAARAALAELERELVHAEPLEAGSELLWIDFAAVSPGNDDAATRRLLEPLAERVAELSLARSRIGDATVALAARFPHLRRLDLRATDVTDAGIAALADHVALEELVVAQTAVGDDSIETLLSLSELKRLFLWDSAFSSEGIARLRSERPALAIDTGKEPLAAELEAEPKIVFKSDRPLPGEPQRAPDSHAPVNATCPVSGSPVNPAFRIVYKDKVVGFCCPNCPKEFWSDPAKFEGKLP